MTTTRCVYSTIAALVAACALVVLGGAPVTADTGSSAYEIDGAHTNVGFKVRHMTVATVRGSFGKVQGRILYDESDLSKSAVEVTIDASSIDTANQQRDDHLRSADFLKVEEFPTITFKSKNVRKTDTGMAVIGDLTIRGVTKEVEIPFSLVGPITDPYGMARIGVEGSLTIDRRDYGLTWNKALETGGLVVGHEVTIELACEGARK